MTITTGSALVIEGLKALAELDKAEDEKDDKEGRVRQDDSAKSKKKPKKDDSEPSNDDSEEEDECTKGKKKPKDSDADGDDDGADDEGSQEEDDCDKGGKRKVKPSEDDDEEDECAKGKKKPEKDDDEESEEEDECEKGKKKPKAQRPDDNSDDEDSEEEETERETQGKKGKDKDEEDRPYRLESKKKKPKKSKDGEENGETGSAVDSEDDEAEEDDKPAKKSIHILKGVNEQDGDFATVLKKAGFPHLYNSAGDTFTVNYGAQMYCSNYGNGKDELIELSKAAFGNKAGNAPDFHPTDDEMDKILALAGKPYDRKALKVYYATSADQNTDRHFEHFATKALESMAMLSYDQPFMMDHNHSQSAGVVGKIFDAKVVNSKNSGRKLVQKIYMLNNGTYQDILEGIESGINNKLSVGVRIRRKDYMCDTCKKPMFVAPGKNGMMEFAFCGHLPGMELEDGAVVAATLADVLDFLELSRVTAPAQKAAAIKSYDANLCYQKLIKSFFLSDSLAAAITKQS